VALELAAREPDTTSCQSRLPTRMTAKARSTHTAARKLAFGYLGSKLSHQARRPTHTTLNGRPDHAVPAPRPDRLRPLVRRSRWPRPVGGIQLRWIESVVDRLSSSGSKLFELSWAHVRVSWSPGRCWSSHAALLGRGGGASPPDRSWAVLSAGVPPGRLRACGPRPLNLQVLPAARERLGTGSPAWSGQSIQGGMSRASSLV
jgi:hypothetical protein